MYQQILSSRASFVIAFWIFATLGAEHAIAQRPVNGNGNVIEQIRPLSRFTAVHIDFVAEVTIVNGETPSFVIEGDENVLPHVGTRIRGGTLMVSQDRWIEPSRPIRIRIGAPFTTELETSGYSEVSVAGISGPRFRVDAGVGTVALQGGVDRLQVRTKTGKIDATDLAAGYADIEVSSFGRVLLGEINTLVVDVSERGLVRYSGTPAIRTPGGDLSDSVLVRAEEYEEPAPVEIANVSFSIINNSLRRVALRVEGPRERPFGYGFDMFPQLRRAENWPVGSRVYLTSKLRGDRLVLVVDADMEGTRVKLFDED